MMPFGASSLFGYAGRMLVRSGRGAAYRDFRRSYGTWRVARLGPYKKEIKSPDDGRQAVHAYFELLREAKFLDKPSD